MINQVSKGSCFTARLAKPKIFAVFCILSFSLGYSHISYGATITHTYDNLNRLTKVVYGDGTTEEFTYDAAGNRLTHIVVLPDITPPTPNPMTWATPPNASSSTAISMVATTATDSGSPPVSYYFDFTDSQTGGTGGFDSDWQSGTSYTNSGLEVNHQYGYRVKARDRANNETEYSSPTRYVYTLIEILTGVTFGTVTSTSIQVQSTNTPSGLNRGSSGLLIENTTNATNSGWKQDNSFWTSTGLLPNTSYSFRAKARNGDGVETGHSPTVAQHTLANWPGTASFSEVTQTSIRANWTANGNPAGTQYWCENTTQGTSSGWTITTYWSSTGLACGTSYTFRVKARNGQGVETPWVILGAQSTQACPDTTPPTDPGSLSASAVSSSQINLSWAASTDTGGSGLAGYKIERCTGGGCIGFSQIAITASTSYSDPGLGASTTYTYRVRAYDNAGNHSGYSNTAWATIPPPTDTAPKVDFDGDGKTDIAIYRASTGAWYVYPSGGGSPYGMGWGGDASDKPSPGDYDGDGKTDIAVYRAGTGAWYVYPSGGGTPYGFGWGGDATDKPTPGDYDGDGKTDIAVYRAGAGAWYVYPSGGGAPYGMGWGGDASDKPSPGDYDGDGKTDIAVYRAGTGAWYVYPSGGGSPYGFGWGGDDTDKPVNINLSAIE
jgi:YD repeat-containing protein